MGKGVLPVFVIFMIRIPRPVFYCDAFSRSCSLPIPTRCTGDGLCECDPPYTGEHCLECVSGISSEGCGLPCTSKSCSGHGRCYGDGMCACYGGYTGAENVNLYVILYCSRELIDSSSYTSEFPGMFKTDSISADLLLKTLFDRGFYLYTLTASFVYTHDNTLI